MWYALLFFHQPQGFVGSASVVCETPRPCHFWVVSEFILKCDPEAVIACVLFFLQKRPFLLHCHFNRIMAGTCGECLGKAFFILF